MVLDWETFKSALGGFSHTSVFYVDDEGYEIPIDSECKLQEALRLSDRNGKLLKLIVYDSRAKCCENVVTYFSNSGQPVDHNKFTAQKILERVKSSKPAEEGIKNLNLISQSQSNASQGQTPPEWFLQYMRKFRKELIFELKSSIHDIIHSVIGKELKSSHIKSETSELSCDKSGIIYSPSAKQSKKKKSFEKESVDKTDQREIKLPKRLERLWSTKSERLEKFDNKSKILLEEKRKLLERKRHAKSKLDKNSSLTSEKRNSCKKSATFLENSVVLRLFPNENFSFMVNVVNDGKARWSTPRLECSYTNGIVPEDVTDTLPRLYPGEFCLVPLKGKSPDIPGLYCMRCRVTDGREKFDREFTCWAKVEPRQNHIGDVQGTVDQLSMVGLEDIFSSSEKKIEENIIEIEKRLQDIELLRPSHSEQKKTLGKEKKRDKKTVEFGVLNSEGKSLMNKRDKESVKYSIDASNYDNKTEENNGKTQKQKSGKKKLKKDGKAESNSDSELSVINMSEDEYFVLLSLSDTESESEETNSLSNEEKGRTVTSNEKEKSFEQKRKLPIKVDIKVNSSQEQNVNQSPTRSRRSPFREEISKPKKMKSKSSEYRFTSAKLSQPTLSLVQDVTFEKKFTFTGEKEEKSPPTEGMTDGRPLRFISTGEKEGKSSLVQGVFEKRSRYVFTGEKEENPKAKEYLEEQIIPKTDSSGRIIYAVNISGFCLPVKDLLDNEEREKWRSLFPRV